MRGLRDPLSRRTIPPPPWTVSLGARSITFVLHAVRGSYSDIPKNSERRFYGTANINSPSPRVTRISLQVAKTFKIPLQIRSHEGTLVFSTLLSTLCRANRSSLCRICRPTLVDRILSRRCIYARGIRCSAKNNLPKEAERTTEESKRDWIRIGRRGKIPVNEIYIIRKII